MPLVIGIISKIIDALVQGGQMKKEEADAARVALVSAAVQRDKTFSEFIQNTSNIIYTLVRNGIVVMFAAALVVPGWGQSIKQNADNLPIYFWLIIGWEFYGNAMLQAIPWFKNGNGKAAVLPAPPIMPTTPLPVPPALGGDHA